MWRTNLTETLLSEVMRLSDYELYHHGVKGMKWGVRRYQNKDGSLTRLGKRRRIGKKNLSITDDEAVERGKKEWGSEIEELYSVTKKYQDVSGLRMHLDQKKRRVALSVEQSDSELKRYHDSYTNEDAWHKDRGTGRSVSDLFSELENHVGTMRSISPATSAVKKSMYKVLGAESIYDDAFGRDRFHFASADKMDFMKKYEYEFCGTVLKELGYKDTEIGRKYIYPFAMGRDDYDPDYDQKW
jgi:hypothetical protein